MHRQLLISILLSLTTSAALAHLSAHRSPDESYEAARNRSVWSLEADFIGRESSVERVKKPLTEIDLSQIPEMPSYEAMEAEFKYVRDTRFLPTYDPQFPRRLTWLYPDDGCYARAEFSRRKLMEHQAAAPMKIFVFGDLVAISPNAIRGFVTWWYHVAVIYRVQDEAYVFDAAINPSRPITLTEWNRAVGGERKLVQYSLCASGAYDPTSNCANPQEVPATVLSSEQSSFLRPEWERLQKLNRDPQSELGDSPPWLAHQIL